MFKGNQKTGSGSIFKRGFLEKSFGSILILLFFQIILPVKSLGEDQAIPMLPNYWDTQNDGDGSISYSQAGIVIRPLASTSPFESHTALILAGITENDPIRDFKATIVASTEEQLRKPKPNSWETFSIFFNYHEGAKGEKKSNFIRLTSDSLELGTYTEAADRSFLSQNKSQKFLMINKEFRLTVGQVYVYTLVKKGNQIEVFLNGQLALRFSGKLNSEDNSIFDVPGAIGFYTEDAQAHLYSIDVQTF